MNGVDSVNISPHLNVVQIQPSAPVRPVQTENTPKLGASINGQDTFINSHAVLKPNNKLEARVDDWLVRNAPSLFINKYLNSDVIENALQTNPRISEILINKGLNPKIYIENIQGKNQEHFITTYEKARELSQNMPKDEQTVLLQAALLHDIGKALIPTQILEKPGKLTDVERAVVDLHAELGGEILKTTNVSKDVIEAVSLHHMPYDVPLKINNETAQILSSSDVYSALKEERPYKAKFDDNKVKSIMENDSKLNPQITEKIFVNAI